MSLDSHFGLSSKRATQGAAVNDPQILGFRVSKETSGIDLSVSV
jgi:hypothetical protein